MAEYTGGSSAITLYDGDQLTGSTVANIDYTKQDAYTRFLYVSNGGLVDNTCVSSGGKMYLYEGGSAHNVSAVGPYNNEAGGNIYVSGGTVEDVHLSKGGRIWVYDGEVRDVSMEVGGNGNPQIRLQGNGVVIGGSNVAGQVTEIYASAGVISNFTFNDKMHVFVSKTAELRDCTFSGTWIRGAGGTMTRITFLNASDLASNSLLTGATMVDCTIAPGALYTMSGGTVSGLTISGDDALFRLNNGRKHDCVLNDVNVYAGGSLHIYKPSADQTTTVNRLTVSGGKAYVSVGVLNDTNVFAGGTMTLSGAQVASKVTVNGLTVSGAGATRASVFLSNSVVDDVTVHSGGRVDLYSGTSATNLTLVGNQTGETTGERIPYVYVYSSVVSGVTTVDNNWHFVVQSQGYVEDFDGTKGYLYISGAPVDDEWSRGVVSGATLRHVVGVRGGMLINATLEAGASLYMGDRGVKSGFGSNITLASGVTAWIASGASMTDTLVSGANASMTVNSGIATRTTVLSGGLLVAGNNAAATIAGATVGAAGSMVVSKGTVSDVLVSGADVGADDSKTVSNFANLVISGGTVNGLSVFGTSGYYGPSNVHTDPQKRVAAAISGGAVVSNVTVGNGGFVTVSNGGALIDVTLSDELGGAWCLVGGKSSAMRTRINVYANGLASNVKIIGPNIVEAFINGTLSGFEFNSKAFVGVGDGGKLIDGVISGYGGTLNGRGGMISGVTLTDRATMFVSKGTVRGNDFLSGGSLRIGSNGTAATAEKAFLSGGFGGPKQDSGGKLYYDYYASGIVSSGGVIKDSLIAPETIVNIYNSGKAENLALRGRDDWTYETMVEAMMARATVYSGGSWSGGDAISYAQMVVVNGGRAEGITLGSNTHFYISAGGVAYNMVIDGCNDLEVRGGTAVGTIVKDGVLRVSSRAASHNGGVVSNTVVSGGSMRLYFADTLASDTIVRGSGRIYGQNGTYENTFVSNGGYASALGGTWNNTVLSSGGSMRFYANGATINGLTTQEGAEFTLDLTQVASGAAAKIDTLANVNAPVTVLNTSNGYTYNLAEVGNENLVVRAACEGIYVNTEAGTTKINPYGRQYTLSADGTTLDVAAYTLEAVTTEAADLATSGTVINNGDMALRWDDVAMTSGSTITFVTEAAGVNGDAWMRINRAALDKGATLYGAEGNFGGTVRYLIHGAGTLGNFAAGAKAGGKVGGVELVSYNNDYGVTYLGGQGTVTGLVSAVISSGNTLSKDFYAGALANYAKTGSRTSVGSINASVRLNTSAGTASEVKHYAKGNIYGASQVKAGTIDTSVSGFTTIHTVGDVTLNLVNGEAAKSDICVFAAGYANGTDSATTDAQKAVYTVDSVTATVSGGNWGKVHGGRGIFGGAFAAGVRAEVAKVDLTVSGGTMGNVYGGGWAQRGGVSAVGSVNVSIKGGTVANVFGGGSTSTSGGATEAGSVTITVSGGTISGNIYARGQMATDGVTTAAVVFTGANDFSCGVYGYSYVETLDPSDATLSFTDYTGSFSGAIGGFATVTIGGNTAMTLGTAAADVSNAAWTFDTTERFTSLSRDAMVDWTTADFDGDTIAINLAADNVTEWDLVSAASTTVYNKFDVQVDGASIATGLDLDQQIASGDYKNWGFTVEENVLKFKNLA